VIVGLGVDMEEITRLGEAIKRHGRTFLERIFTPAEIAYCERHRDAVDRMIASLHHRGPDDRGRHTTEKLSMGMTRLAIGIAAEHKDDGIACNSLWPVTIIESLASINWGLGDRSQWRSPEILCDAMMEILRTEPPSLTGRQILDEPFLRERGWTDAQLDAYWLEGKPPAHPVFIDGRPGSSM